MQQHATRGTTAVSVFSAQKCFATLSCFNGTKHFQEMEVDV